MPVVTVVPGQGYSQSVMTLSESPRPPRTGVPTEERESFFEREVMQHLDALYRTALRMTRNPQDAEDLVQETMLRAFRFLDRFEPGTNLRAWLFKILTNTYINRYRKASSEPRVDSLDDSEELSLYRYLDNEAASRGGSVEAQVLDRFAEQDIKTAIEALPPQYRITVLLADVEGFSYNDIAEITNVKKGTVMSRLFRGRRLLQKALVDQARSAGFAGGNRS
ncbi:MAG TPA: sigma-70 family RNA polymerase sigma factor [Chloroflexota bacterium]|nr:sigma-70 family RNA polymerase sigma factor [Chloroflexota bacterium]